MNSNRPPRFINLIIALECVLLAAFLILLSPLGVMVSDNLPANGIGTKMQGEITGSEESDSEESGAGEKKDFIKWVDFQVSREAMQKAFRYDVDTCQSEIHLNWIELLAYLGTRYGGDFSRYKASDMENIAQRILGGEKMEEITADMKYYSYYLEAYTAVLGGMVGEFQVEIPASEAPEFVLKEAQKSGNADSSGENQAAESGQENGTSGQDVVWVTKYGLKAFSPIAKNYPYQDYDDFGAARSYGFKRQHLGHDMMGQVGTPVICVESGYVEAIGWNQYGGWRLGIRSFDGKRYYYYAHLRKNYPYHKSLKEGSVVQAGDVIGYLGRTGYSRTENTNNIEEAHLHFGIQLIFDESQKEGNHEIWIDCYEIVKFLSINRCETVKKQETKEYYRKFQMIDPSIPGGPLEQRIPEENEMSENENLTESGSGEGNGNPIESGSGEGNGNPIESGSGEGNGNSAESGSGEGNGNSAESGSGEGNGNPIESGSGEGNGNSAESGSGKGNRNSAESGSEEGNRNSAESGSGEGNGNPIESGSGEGSGNLAKSGGGEGNGNPIESGSIEEQKSSAESEVAEESSRI